MAKIDHHVHTSRHSPDSLIEPKVLIERAIQAGLDAVVITEHDYQWEADELEELNREADGLIVLSGAEVSTRQGHFLVYGLPDLDETPPGIDVGDLIRVVRRHGGAIVGAHPFRWDQDFAGIVAKHGPAFDALELVSNNITPETRHRAEALLREHPMGVTGSSDGHSPEIVGCYHTEFSEPITTIGQFVAALKRREGRPRHCPGRAQTSGPVD